MDSGDSQQSDGPKGEMFVDADEYLYDQWADHLHEILRSISPEEGARIRNSPAYGMAAYSYFFQIRSGLHVILKGEADHEGRALTHEIRRIAMQEAESLAAAQLHRGKVYEPRWLDIVLRDIAKCRLLDFGPLLARLEHQVFQEPSVFVSVRLGDTGPRLEICTLLKAILKQMNAPFALARHESMTQPDQFLKNIEAYVRESHQILGIFAFFCGAGFSPGRLPFIHFTSKAAYFEASWMSRAQTVFLILHELAHVVLGHLDRNAPFHETLFELPKGLSLNGTPFEFTRRMRQEIEADTLAFRCLLETPLHDDMDVDLKLRSVGLFLGYMTTFESLSAARFDAEAQKIVGVSTSTESAVRQYLFLRHFKHLWTSAGEAAAFDYLNHTIETFPVWLENGDMTTLDGVLTGRFDDAR